VHTIRIRRRIDSDRSYLPELRPLIGKVVEIIIVEGPEASEVRETEEAFFGLAPPLPSAEEQAAHLARLREMAQSDPRIASLLQAREADAIDVDRVIEARGRQ
jgi:hypothetical protein